MAVKIKRKKPEAEAPEVEVLADSDQVLAATQETFGWLQQNRNLVLGVVGGGLVAIIAGSLAWDASKVGAIEDAAPAISAIAVASAGVGTEDGQYADQAARAQAVLSALGDSEIPAAQVLRASAQVSTGDAATAAGTFRAATAATTGTPQAVLTFAGAAAEAESGNVEGALGSLEQLAADQPAFAPAAELRRARLMDAYGEPRSALDAYRAYVSAHPADVGVGDAENRIAQLELTLGVAPVATDEAPADGDE